MVTSKMYYIMSLKHTKPEDNMVLWWRPECKGYTYYIDEAGIYPEAEIKEKPEYYNDGKDTVAVLCEVVRSVAVFMVPNDGRFETLKQRGWPRK